MRSLSQKRFSSTVRALLADRHAKGSPALGARPGVGTRRRKGRSVVVMRRELESFRNAQAAPYWHHDHRPS
jgi:hypothetical protein